MERSEVFALLAAKGAAKAVVHFSGGNDEGGVDGIELLDKDGNVETLCTGSAICEVCEAEEDAAACPECQRSFGPHYTGPCNH